MIVNYHINPILKQVFILEPYSLIYNIYIFSMQYLFYEVLPLIHKRLLSHTIKNQTC